MNVICNNKGKALYCKTDCQHGKPHNPKVWSDLIDCRTKSKCSIIDKICQCVEKEIELFEK
jgi:hypothetical protein